MFAAAFVFAFGIGLFIAPQPADYKVRLLRERGLGSAGCQRVLFGSLPKSLSNASLRGDSATRGSRRQAADDNRLAACAPQSSSLHARATTAGVARVSHPP